MSTEARYRCVDVSLFRMGGHMAMAQGQVSGSLQLLDGPLLQLLVGCGTFLTLREHAEALAPACRAAPADLLPRLAQLARAGLLLSYDDVRARILSATQPPPPPISAISIVTRDRPAALLRAAESLADNCRAHGRAPALYVLDDSAPAAQVESRAALAELQRRGPLRIHHLGAEEKRALQEALRRGAGVPAEIVEFALGNPCGAPRFGGANYNAMLLRGAGALHVSVDDDTVCRLARLGASPALRISAQHDVTELLVMEGREAVLGQVRAEERDLLALHEELLGRGVGDCVERTGAEGAVDLDEVSGPLLRALSPRASVAVTSLGLYGDSGMGSPGYYLGLQGRSRQHLLRSEAAYEAACASRQVLRAAPRPTISAGAYLMSYCLGYDGRSLLPPFFPVLRNCDGVFAATLRHCLADRYVAHLPWALLHDPPEPRTLTRAALFGREATRARLSDLLVQLLQRSPPRRSGGGTDGAAQLQALGDHLVEIGELPAGDFAALTREVLLRRAEQRILYLEGLLQLHRLTPRGWAEDVARQITALREAHRRPSGTSPEDLPDDDPRTPARAQELIRRHGQLLQAWPALWQAALALDRPE